MRFFLLIFFILTFKNVKSQYLIFGDPVRIEVGINFGPTFFLGDLGGNHGYGSTFIKDVNIPLTQLMKGVYVSFYPNNFYGIRVSTDYTYVEGQDNIINTNGRPELYRKQRNLNFRSNIYEASVGVELYPFSQKEHLSRINPYVFLGIGVFHFNPMGSLTENGITTWYYLQPLHTEGEGFPEYPNRKNYKLTQINIPIGSGVKYQISDRVSASFEILYRKTFTDYIDDVSTNYIDPKLFFKYLPFSQALIASKISNKAIDGITSVTESESPGEQRGNPNNNDAYFSSLLKIGYRIGNNYDKDVYNHGNYSGHLKRRLSCPERF